MANVAVLGTGRMGSATLARNPFAAVRNHDVILSALDDGDPTRPVLLDPAVLAALTPGAVVCDLGTSGVAAAGEVTRGLSDARIRRPVARGTRSTAWLP